MESIERNTLLTCVSFTMCIENYSDAISNKITNRMMFILENKKIFQKDIQHKIHMEKQRRIQINRVNLSKGTFNMLSFNNYFNWSSIR